MPSPEEAEEIARLRREKPELTQKEIAAKVGVSVHAVRRTLRQERDNEAAAATERPHKQQQEQQQQQQQGQQQQQRQQEQLQQEQGEEGHGAGAAMVDGLAAALRAEQLTELATQIAAMFPGRVASSHACPDNQIPLRNPSPNDILNHVEYGKFGFQRFARRRQGAWDSDDEFDLDRAEKYKKVLQCFKDIDWDGLKAISVMPQVKHGQVLGLKHFVLERSGMSKTLYALTDRPDGKLFLQWEVSLWGVLMRGFWAAWPDYETPIHMAVDFVNEKFDAKSLMLFDGNARKLFRDMARQKSWPNNPVGGRQIAEAAKSIVQRFAGKPAVPACGDDPFSMMMAAVMGGGSAALRGVRYPTPPESDDDCDGDEGSSAFAIQPVQGRGLGVVATRHIQRGETILTERPLLDCELDARRLLRAVAEEGGGLGGDPAEDWFAKHYPVRVSVGVSVGAFVIEDLRTRATIAAVRGVSAAFARLNEQKRSLVMALHDRYEAEFGQKTPYGVYLTNAMGKSWEEQASALFNLSSRFNHSCSPNAYRNFDTEEKSLRIYACRDIPCGEEICIAYGEILAPRAARQAELREAFAFECSCDVCTLPPAECKASDSRRVEMGVLDNRILLEGRVSARRGLKLVQDYEKLYSAEKLQQPLMESRFCYDGFQFAAALGDAKAAKAWMDRVVQASMIVDGEGSANLKQHLALQKNVKAHPCWGFQAHR